MSAAAAPLRRAPVRHDAVAGPFGLALLMHALLFVAMTFAVQWRTQPQAPIVAELWSGLPPPAVELAPTPPPPPPPVVQPPPPPPPPEPERPADIALEQKKAPPKVEPPKEEKKPEPKKEEKKPEPKKAEARKEEPKKDAKKAEPTKAEQRPPTDLERIMAQANAQGQPAAATGTSAAGSTVLGADATYAAQIIGCIRPHLVFVVPEGTSAAVCADFRVELMPDGSVAGVRLVRPSGLANYDAAAERAIRRCDPFPRKRDGGIDRTIDVRMYPVEAR
jgi:colicin import membrane protein